MNLGNFWCIFFLIKNFLTNLETNFTLLWPLCRPWQPNYQKNGQNILYIQCDHYYMSQKCWLTTFIVKLQSSLTVQSKSVGLGVDTKMTVQTPPHHTNSTWAPWASEQHSLMTTKYRLINNNKHDNNNKINNKIISFRSLRLISIDHN